MCAEQVDAKNHGRISELGQRVLSGGSLAHQDAEWLLDLEQSADVFDLLSWANRLREHYRGNQIQLCSIVNAKAGGCAEDCRFCAQSAGHHTDTLRHGFVDPEPVLAAAGEAQANGVMALGLVAAWKGIQEGPLLDEICARFVELSQSGLVRADASLGIISSLEVARRLRQAGVVCYNHNLETSKAFFPQVCSTHTYEERVQTIRYLKQTGIMVCSGGIIGMGETRRDRLALAFALRELEVDMVPVNILNPIPGTPFEDVPALVPLEILKTIACFRFILPRQEILIAGGRSVNLRELQSLIFLAGASGLMVGNYLTTANEPVEKDLRMLKDLGLVPRQNPPAAAPPVTADSPLSAYV
jgi:biotin synthase